MKTLAEVKELLKERADLATLIAKDTKLFKTGQGFKACCPLPGHSEKTPSFHINTRDNYFYCYGCQRGGDIFTYLEHTRGQPFMETLKELAEQYHIELPKNQGHNASTEPSPALQARDQALSLMERACKYFEENLHRASSPGAEAAQKYLASRNYTLEMAKKFRLGWAPERGSSLANKLADLGLISVGQDIGLIARGRSSEDFFRARLMIPIEDHRGRVVAFSGRAIGLSENEGPKYKNSPETQIFKKKEVLYGLSRAVKGTREEGWLTIVEGFFDAWAFERMDIPSVAVMGVALTPEHLERLSKICKQVVLVLDADRAGIESTKRSLPLLYQFDFEVKVFSELEGKDPDEWLAQFKGSREEVYRRLQRAPEGMDWWAMQVINESRDKGMNELQIVHRLEELWPVLPSPAHRRIWLKSLAPTLGMTELQLSKHFSELKIERSAEAKGPSAEGQELEDLPLRQTMQNKAPDFSDPKDYLIQEIVALLVRFGSVWPKIHQEGEGELLRLALEGTTLELPFARAHQGDTFQPKALIEALKLAGLDLYVAKALVLDETAQGEGQNAQGRDHKKLLRDMCLQLVTQKKNNLIKRLVLQLKNSADESKTAQILQQIQVLQKEKEELKKFSFPL